MFHRLLALVAALAATACTVTLDGEGVLVREQRRFTVSGTPDVTLSTIDGSIDVRSWDRNEVLVEVEKRADSEEVAEALVVQASQEGNTIRIEVPATRVRNNRFNQSVSLRVTVPSSVTLRATTEDGSIATERLDGTLVLRTGDGSIRADDITGGLDLGAGDGSISVRGQFAAFRADTGDGSMNIEIEEGSVMNGDWSLTTGDGSITLRVPDDFSAEMDAQSGNGTIVLDGQEARARADGSSGNGGMAVMRTRLGAGGRTLLLRSGDGTIRVRSR